MQTLFSIILPLLGVLAIRPFLNPVPSLSLSSPNPPPLTATAQYSYFNHVPAFSLVFIRRSSSPFRPSVINTVPSKYSFHPSSLWRCKSQSSSKPMFPLIFICRARIRLPREQQFCDLHVY